jgi:hypothetical protein
MIRTFKDPYKINLIITILFGVSIAVAVYMLLRLPSQLMIPTGFEAFTSTYIAIAFAFAMGLFSALRGIQYKRELIVFRDRKTDMTAAERDAAEENKNTISLDTVKNALKSATTSKDIIQQGLQAVCKQLNAGQGAFYHKLIQEEKTFVELSAGYALSINENKKIQYELGEGLIGQAAATGQLLYLDEVPEGYIKIISGLGSASPRHLLIVPAKTGNEVAGVMEVASFTSFNTEQKKFVEQAAQLIADHIQNKN